MFVRVNDCVIVNTNAIQAIEEGAAKWQSNDAHTYCDMVNLAGDTCIALDNKYYSRFYAALRVCNVAEIETAKRKEVNYLHRCD